ncbi:MAG: SMP-30/gluconolactonase/LRE family protein [Polaromonas sp.]|nr:SMP-30/gluconolactonase/LRE family protein [Polaromonas sp.]
MQKSTPEPAIQDASSPAGPGVLEKAMVLLNIVSSAASPMTFTDLLRAASLPKATLHRILGTLMREGLLRHDSYTKTYRLGLRLLELAHEVWSDFDLRLAAQDEMTRLRRVEGESVFLTVPDGTSIVIAASEEAGRESGRASQVGLRLPLHASAAGKAILAYSDPVRQAQLLASSLQAFTPATVVTAALLRAELNLTRARGYAVELMEHLPDTVSVAAPILDMQGQAIGAIAITARLGRMTPARAHQLSASVIGASRAISHNAGGQFMSIAPQAVPQGDSAIPVRCVTEATALLGECPTWSPRDGALYWVDILTPSIHCLDMARGTETETKIGTMVSVAIPKATGGLLVATPGGLMTFTDASTPMSLVCHPEDRVGNRYNDGKCDRMGRLWVGSLDMGTAANRGNLFKVEADGSWEKMDEGFTIANGMGWSPDNTVMYFIDSFRRTVYAYDFDLRAGSIANRRALITLTEEEGVPDGLTIDSDGCLWIAIWDAWHVSRYSPDGQEMMRVRMPVPRPTSCCFGGPHLDTLYITSASIRLNAEALAAAPLSGSLFSIQIPGVRGLPEASFAG